ncbi:MAG: ATP-binding protein [Bacteroidales bacterium]|nr:ATP-binding protein [Bacteroidales bacterium]
MKTTLLPPNPSRLIEGLRDTGYDFNTALSDIIDNSIDAGASLVDIRILMDTDGDVRITIADNGCGMDEATLLNGMTYGAPEKSDPSRLGKFGLGLKTASTAFARKLSVITRNSANSRLLKATWDLDFVIKVGDWQLILQDPDEEEVELFEEIAHETTGTLVIWEKIDRLLKVYKKPGCQQARKALETIVDAFRDHASMVFQRFLDTKDGRARNIKMVLNGEPLLPWDPFCINEPGTELVAQIDQPVEFDNGECANFILKAFVLPRREEFSTPEAAKKARLGNHTQGIYLYRENRLIHSADWFGMFTKEPHYSLLRVDFSFSHELDLALKVDIKKSKIILNPDLYDLILNKFLPAPRNAASERYRIGKKIDINRATQNAHEISNKSISSKEQDVIRSTIEVIDKDVVSVKNNSGTVVLKLKVMDSASSEKVCVNPVESLDDGLLWEPALINEHHAVRINKGHPYYHKVYIPNLNSGVLVQGMDSLLWALAEAELSTINEATKRHFEELRYEVSRILRKLVEDLPEPELGNL